MKEPQLSGIAKALAAHGRKGDTELVHVSKKELEMLEKYGEGLGIHLTRNPQTGLPEAFNWGGMAGSVVAPLALLAITAATGGVAAPWMLAAAGAAGGAGGTLLGGGSTDEALMSGVMGGIGGYGMGSLAGGVAQAGVEKAAEEAVTQTATQTLADAGANAASSNVPGIFGQGLQQGAQQGVTEAAAQTGGQTAFQQLAQSAQQGAPIITEGSSQAAGSVVNGAFVPNATPAVAPATPLQSTPMTGLQQMSKGWEAISGSPQSLGNFAWDNAKNIGAAGLGAYGSGAMSVGQSGNISTEPEEDTSNPYTAEWYVDPATGQRRTRAVRAASGGTMFSDYDAADAKADGGYSPGGGVNFAHGGAASLYKKLDTVRRMAAGGSAGSGIVGTNAGNTAAKTGPVLAKGFFSDADLRNATPEQLATMKALMQAQRELVPSPMRRRQEFAAAAGGISDLGGYSDGGRMLRGPGDGVSDSIPASIEGKRPARLADGEFVVPARAVSELGNGSTEAGSKQLYKMLDRIAAKRKSGKGLAYQANPNKLLPA